MSKRVTHYVYVRLLVEHLVEEGTSPKQAVVEASKRVKQALDSPVGTGMTVVDAEWSRQQQ